VNRQIGSLSLKRFDAFGEVSSNDFEDEVGGIVRIFNGEISDASTSTADEELKGREVVLKEYPERFSELARNEVSSHRAVQSRDVDCENISKLLGTAPSGRMGETWLVFSASEIYPVSYWLDVASGEKAVPTRAQGQKGWTLLNLIDPDLELNRRKAFVIAILRGAIKGLAGLHRSNLLHQNLSADSIVLSSIDERARGEPKVKLRELSFCVSVSESSLRGGGTLEEIWDQSQRASPSGGKVNIRDDHEKALWKQAEEEGCGTFLQKKNFGIADDVKQMGLVALFVCLKSFSGPSQSQFDFPTLKRYVEVTFSGDVRDEFRDYMGADPQYAEVVEWLDEFEGWELFQAMVQRDWKQRPTAESCLLHPFLQQPLKYK